MIQVSTLSGALLDYFTARAIGRDARILSATPRFEGVERTNIDAVCFAAVPGKVNWYEPFSPSTDWQQGGLLIIERERIQVCIVGNRWVVPPDDYRSQQFDLAEGPTPLIAACRALVASKYGAAVTYEGAIP